MRMGLLVTEKTMPDGTIEITVTAPPGDDKP